MRHNAALAARHGAALRQLFAGARPRLTDAAWQVWSDLPGTGHVGNPGRGRPVPPVAISGPDPAAEADGSGRDGCVSGRP